MERLRDLFEPDVGKAAAVAVVSSSRFKLIGRWRLLRSTNTQVDTPRKLPARGSRRQPERVRHVQPGSLTTDTTPPVASSVLVRRPGGSFCKSRFDSILKEVRKLNQDNDGIVTKGYYTCLCGSLFESPDSFMLCIDSHIRPFHCIRCREDGIHNIHNFTSLAACKGHIRRHHDLAPYQRHLEESVDWEMDDFERQVKGLRAHAEYLAETYKKRRHPSVSSDSAIPIPECSGPNSKTSTTESSDNCDVSSDAATNQSPQIQAACGVSDPEPIELTWDWPPTKELAWDWPPAEAASVSPGRDISIGKDCTLDAGCISGHTEYGHETDPKEALPQQDGSGTNIKQDGMSVREIFDNCSRAAYNKLKASASTISCSVAFKGFIQRLGSHDDLVLRGFASFDRFLSHETLSSLEDVYSFLHIAFAISQTQTDTPVRSTPEEFHYSIGVLRERLSDSKISVEDKVDGCTYVYRERDLFDEIVEVMQDEIDYAISWIGERTGGLFMSSMASKAHNLQQARRMLIAGAIADNSDLVHPGPRTCHSDTGSLDSCIPASSGFFPLDGDIFEPAFTSDFHMSGTHSPRLIPDSNQSIPPRSLPPDGPKWLEIVTGSVFLIILGFIKMLDRRDGLFFPTKAPYSFLCDLDPEPDAPPAPAHADIDCSMGTNDEQDLAKVVEEQVVNAVPVVNQQLSMLLETGIFLMRQGVIKTIAHLEGYILALAEHFYQTNLQRVSFVGSFLESSWKCTNSLRDASKDESWKSAMGTDRHIAHPYTQALLDTTDESSPDTSPDFALEDWDSELGGLPLRHDVAVEDSKMEDVSPQAVATVPDFANQSDISPGPTGSAMTHIDKNVGSAAEPICDLGTCHNKVFSSICNLLRHQRAAHTANVYYCGVENCTHVAKRADNVDRHRLRVHGIIKEKVIKKRRARTRAILGRV